MNFNNPLDPQTPSNFQTSLAGGVAGATRVFIGSFFYPQESQQIPNQLGIEEANRTSTSPEERVGHRLNQVAQAVMLKLDSKLDEKLGENEIVLLAQNKHSIIDSKALSLDLVDDLQQVVSYNAPEALAKSTINELTDYLKRYTQAYERIQQGKEEGLFLTPQEENDAWVLFMGSDYWLPTVYEKMDEPSSVTLSCLDRGHFLAPIVGGGTLSKAVANPHVQRFFREEMDPVRQTLSDQEMSYSTATFGAVKNAIEQFIGFLSNVPGNQQQVVEGPQLPLEPHVFLVEKVGTLEVVSHCSQQAQQLGIRPGMEFSRAALLWNGQVNLAEGSLAVKVEDIEQFGGRKTLRKSIKDLVLQVLTLPTVAMREVVLNQVLAVPYLGRPLAALTRAVLWLGGAFVKGFNSFAVGFPSREALAEEIANNLIQHLFNPAVIAAPLVIINRIFEMIERKSAAGAEGAPARDAYLGELVVELMKLFTTLCPSLFKIKRPKIVQACLYAASWLFRKLGTRLLVNRFTLGYVRTLLPNRLEATSLTSWLEESARSLRGSTDMLATTHAILSSGYQRLGELGFVSTEQSHFAEGSVSKEHLIHHTVIAAARSFINIKFFSEHYAFKQICDDLLGVMERGEGLTGEMVEPLVVKVTEKRNRLEEERNFARGMLGRLNESVELNPLTVITGFADIGDRLNGMITYWEQIAENVGDELVRQNRDLDETSHELKNVLEFLSRSKLKKLRDKHNTMLTNIDSTDVKDVKYLMRQINDEVASLENTRQQLLTYFSAQERSLNVVIRDYNQGLAHPLNSDTVRGWINTLLHESEIATFSDKYAEEEIRLTESIRQYEGLIEEALRGLGEDFERVENNPMIRDQLFQSKARFYESIVEPFHEAIPGRRPQAQQTHESSLLGWMKRGAAMVSSVVRETSQFFKGWNDEQMNNPSILEEINFYLPQTFLAQRNQIATLRSLKALEEKKLLELKRGFSGKALFFDPVWILEQSGEQFLSALKNHLPVDWIATLLRPPVQEEAQPVAAPAVQEAEVVVPAAEAVQEQEPVEEVHEGEAENQPVEEAAVVQDEADDVVLVEAVAEQPEQPQAPAVAEAQPVEAPVAVEVAPIDVVAGMTEYVKNIAIYRGYRILQDAWANS